MLFLYLYQRLLINQLLVMHSVKEHILRYFLSSMAKCQGADFLNSTVSRSIGFCFLCKSSVKEFFFFDKIKLAITPPTILIIVASQYQRFDKSTKTTKTTKTTPIATTKNIIASKFLVIVNFLKICSLPNNNNYNFLKLNCYKKLQNFSKERAIFQFFSKEKG